MNSSTEMAELLMGAQELPLWVRGGWVLQFILECPQMACVLKAWFLAHGTIERWLRL